MAEKAYGWTPYRYGFNNPIIFTDPTGMLEDWFENEQTGDVYYNTNMKKGDEGTRAMKGEGWVHMGENNMFSDGSFVDKNSDLNILKDNNGKIGYDKEGFYGELMLKVNDAIKFMDTQGYKLVPSELEVTDNALITNELKGSRSGPSINGIALTTRSWEPKAVTYVENSATPILTDSRITFSNTVMLTGTFQTSMRTNTYRWNTTNVFNSYWRKKAFILPINPREKITHVSPYNLGDGNLKNYYIK